jgi:hypothetical protein
MLCGTLLSLEAGRHPSIEETNGTKIDCPYAALSYSDLRAYHDNLFFGDWRLSASNIYDLQRTYFMLGRYLEALEKRFNGKMDSYCQGILEKAQGVYLNCDPRIFGYDSIWSLDGVLSLAHTLLNRLLRGGGEDNHRATDYEPYYEITTVPFREEL